MTSKIILVGPLLVEILHDAPITPAIERHVAAVMADVVDALAMLGDSETPPPMQFHVNAD